MDTPLFTVIRRIRREHKRIKNNEYLSGSNHPTGLDLESVAYTLSIVYSIPSSSILTELNKEQSH